MKDKYYVQNTLEVRYTKQDFSHSVKLLSRLVSVLGPGTSVVGLVSGLRSDIPM